MASSPFIRQVFVAVAPQLGALSLGGSLGFPSILFQQFQSNESSIRPDLNTMTWITSMHGLAGIGAILTPSIMQVKGRKFTFIASCLLLIIGWALAFTAWDAYMVLLAEAFLGFGCNSLTIVNLVTISEMLAPKHRTVSIMLLGISQSFGFLASTSIGSFVYWKTLALIMCSPIVIALILVSFCPESPPWLMYKGKLEQSEKAFTWLRGTDDDAKKELLSLILTQREMRDSKAKVSFCQEICEKIKMKDFYMPSIHMILIISNIYFNGTICLITYSKYVMEIATGDEKSAKFWFLMINTTIVFGAFISLVFTKYFSNKIIICIGGISNLFLLTNSLITYLQYLGLISKDSLMFDYMLFSFFAFCHSGFNTVTFVVAIEVIPVKHRGLGGILFNLTTCLLFFGTVKLLPFMIMYLQLWGTCFLFSICGIICTILIWRYVPETKGKTLQEIEDFYNHGYFIVKQDSDDNMVVRTLIRE